MQTTLLISSCTDPAGTLIHQELNTLLEQHPDLLSRVRHWYAKERLIYLNGPDLPADADQILFLSRHASEKPRPVLTVHVTGNFGQADYGGEPRTLTKAATILMHSLLNGLVRHAPPGFEVMYEATHHGPTGIPLPSCFIEIGSTEMEWNDRIGAQAVAMAVIDALLADTSLTIPLAGFGGTHYTQRQTEISKVTRGGFGHIMPSRDIRFLTVPLFRDMVADSGAIAIYIDGKSMSGEDERKIIHLAEENQVPVVGRGDLSRIPRMEFSEFLSIRSCASSEVPGCSVIIHDLHECPFPEVVRIPGDLLDEVMKNDAEEFFSALDGLPVVHLAGNGKACHSLFITNKEFCGKIADELIHLCIILLQSRYTCSFEGDFLIIMKNRFDPKKAAAAGVPAGPLFSTLRDGKPVTVGGSLILPDMVMTKSEQRIHIPQRKGR